MDLGGASRRSEAMGAGKEGRHPYPFPVDASEVVEREPDSVATRHRENISCGGKYNTHNPYCYALACVCEIDGLWSRTQ